MTNAFSPVVAEILNGFKNNQATLDPSSGQEPFGSCIVVETKTRGTVRLECSVMTYPSSIAIVRFCICTEYAPPLYEDNLTSEDCKNLKIACQKLLTELLNQKKVAEQQNKINLWSNPPKAKQSIWQKLKQVWRGHS